MKLYLVDYPTFGLCVEGPGSYETRSFSDKYEKEWRRVSQIGAEQSQQFTAKVFSFVHAQKPINEPLH